jgi:flagellar biosynthesis protein FlhB
MAEETGQSKTEAPSQRRRDEARRQGRVAVSQELASAVLFFAGMLALLHGARALGAGLLESVRAGIVLSPRHELNANGAEVLFGRLASTGLQLLGPFLALLFLVAGGVMVLQVGFHFTPDLLTINPERLSLAEGAGRMFSLGGLWRGLSAVLKLGALSWVAWVVVSGRRHEMVALGQYDLSAAVGITWGMTVRLALTAGGTMVALGAADYGYKWFQLEQSLKMSKQELIDEHKQDEGDPQVKARIRKMGRELSQRRMMRDVPAATVVITNPTHFAVALRYDKDRQSAPRVVAKGAGHVAKRIVEAARRHAVPVIERKAVARALFKAVKVGQDIPMALYQAVAEVLAFVYRLRA